MLCKDVFIANLKFNLSSWQVWFSLAEDIDNPHEVFNTALQSLVYTGDSYSSEQDFFEKAIKKIETYGFKKETHNSVRRF